MNKERKPPAKEEITMSHFTRRDVLQILAMAGRDELAFEKHEVSRYTYS